MLFTIHTLMNLRGNSIGTDDDDDDDETTMDDDDGRQHLNLFFLLIGMDLMTIRDYPIMKLPSTQNSNRVFPMISYHLCQRLMEIYPNNRVLPAA